MPFGIVFSMHILVRALKLTGVRAQTMMSQYPAVHVVLEIHFLASAFLNCSQYALS